MKTALNAKLKSEGKEEVDPLTFAKNLKQTAKELGIPSELLSRSVNEGFSGCEKKRFEILQMSILKPYLSILDETDSGLDVDALKIVTKGVNNLRDKVSSFLIITHYERLLTFIVPDRVHVMINGKIVFAAQEERFSRVKNDMGFPNEKRKLQKHFQSKA